MKIFLLKINIKILNFFIIFILLQLIFIRKIQKKSCNLRSSARQVAQILKNKVDAPTKKWFDPSLEKKQNHRINKAKVTELEEVNKSNEGFNFENELSKVKIHVPLTELMKIPSF